MKKSEESIRGWWSQYWPVLGGLAVLLTVIAASAGINVIAALPYLLLPGACLLMHLFMHRGHQGGDDHHRPGSQ